MYLPRSGTALSGLLFSLIFSIGIVFAADSGKGTINGNITDARTGKGIAGAWVKANLGLETRAATTDSVGKFTLRDIPEGTGFTVTAEKPGYRTASASATVVGTRPADLSLTLADIYLEMLSPRGEHLVAGTDLDIRWEAVGIEKLRIEFSPNGGRAWLMLADSVDARKGAWSWPVPDIPTTNGVIRITDISRPNLTARSKIPFIITST